MPSARGRQGHGAVLGGGLCPECSSRTHTMGTPWGLEPDPGSSMSPLPRVFNLVPTQC